MSADKKNGEIKMSKYAWEVLARSDGKTIESVDAFTAEVLRRCGMAKGRFQAMYGPMKLTTRGQVARRAVLAHVAAKRSHDT